ncbi:TlpA family protein disulfide reductase [Marinicrinis sediminis]|uniref:TlpA family protein disulfide reductase n=1 Tax=Marinicrinis sediminis TaxID=1652465 RepID=A0ABW5REY3_9BACL
MKCSLPATVSYKKTGGLLVLLMTMLLSACGANHAAESRPSNGSPEQAANLPDSIVIPIEKRAHVPPFQLEGLSDDGIDSQQVNKPMFINFWATWCHYCREEMPGFNEIVKDYEDKIAVAAINLTHLDNRDTVQSYIDENQYTFPVYLDEEGEVTQDFRVLSTPTVIMLDHQGRIAYKKIGAGGEEGEKLLRLALDELIEEQSHHQEGNLE